MGSSANVGSALFEAFDPVGCTDAWYDKWKRDPNSKYHALIHRVLERGGTDEEAALAIRARWHDVGSEASRLGTAIHLYAELRANRVSVDVPNELLKEVQQLNSFLRSSFVRDAGLQPYRTELAVAFRVEGRAVTAGQIDALYRGAAGEYTVIDYKRVAAHHALQPWATAFRDAYGKPPVDLLPDTPFWRYSLQQV